VALQFRRGTAEQRETVSFTPLPGEPIYETDTNKLFIGDGTTPGGVDLFSSFQLTDCNDVTLTSDVLYSIASYSITSQVVTINTVAIHPFATNDTIVIQNSPITALNGTRVVTETPSATSFKFALTGATNITTTSTSGFCRKTIADGSTLIYDSTTSRWENQLIPAPSLVTLPDVNFTPAISAAYNYLPLVYDNINDEWINVPAFGLLSILNDVDEATNPPAAGDVLIYNEDPGDLDIPWKWRPGTPRTNLSDCYDVDFTATPTNGKVLTYNSATSKWIASSPAGGSAVQTTSFAFITPTTAPTTAIANSQELGRNFGTWYEINNANSATIFQGPSSTTYNPSLTGITFNATDGQFSGFTQGRYRADATINLIINNPTPNFYTSPNRIPVFLVYLADVTLGFRLVDAMIGLLPYASYGNAAASVTASLSLEFVAEESTAANSTVFVTLDQNMSGAYYAINSYITFTKLSGL